MEANVLANVVIINRLEVHKATNDGKRAERAIETMEKTHDFVKSVKALATNGKKNANIRVQDAIPADLMGEKRELEHIGSRWRKESI